MQPKIDYLHLQYLASWCIHSHMFAELKWCYLDCPKSEAKTFRSIFWALFYPSLGKSKWIWLGDTYPMNHKVFWVKQYWSHPLGNSSFRISRHVYSISHSILYLKIYAFNFNISLLNNSILLSFVICSKTFFRLIDFLNRNVSVYLIQFLSPESSQVLVVIRI